LNPSGFEKYRRSRIAGNAVVTFGAPFSGTNVNAPPFELAGVLVRFNHVACFIVNANHSIVRPAAKFFVRQNLCAIGARHHLGRRSPQDKTGDRRYRLSRSQFSIRFVERNAAFGIAA
jgi:hypothetical protein